MFVCRIGLACLVGQLFLADPSSVRAGESDVDYGRHVRPILAKHCFTCHGPDEDARQAGLRLDQQEDAHADLGGYAAVTPGDPEHSELMVRVTSEDEDLRMPPADADNALSPSQIETLRQWIQSGGQYTRHWAFVPAQKPALPSTRQAGWCRGPIDRFVLKRMEQAGLAPAPEADPETLIRRVYLDLLGLTPTPEEVQRFLDDSHPDAYERLVDRLLASPAYGERFARSWLDLARYSDTNGYEKDRPRTIWPYRDWVIDALNRDLPYDQFSIEQLAGDMLANATREQKIATGFHRNTMLNEEGGIDPLEYRFYALVDRVATTGTVWMGLTTGCAQCHTHKYDPITHSDYYALMALMDNADEPELNADPPDVLERRQSLLEQVRQAEQDLVDRTLFSPQGSADIKDAFGEYCRRQRQQVSRWRTVPPDRLESTKPLLTLQPDGSVLASGDATKRDVYTLTMPPLDGSDPVTAIRIEAMPHRSLPDTGPGLAFYEGRRGDFFLSELKLAAGEAPIDLGIGSTTVAGGGKKNGTTFPGNVLDGDGSTGWSIPQNQDKTQRLVIPLKQPRRLDQPWTIEMLFERHYVAGLGHFRIDVTTDDAPTANALSSDLQQQLVRHQDDEALPDSTRRGLAIAFARTSEMLAGDRKPIEQLRKQIPDPVRTLVMRERPASNQRVTRRHHRGEYLQPKEVVEGGIPSVFGSAASEPAASEAAESGRSDVDQPTNRLELARWLVSRNNPLVGRVTANRAWREFFGAGIVRTSGDFGTQSEPPTHPELIDWLDRWLRDSSPSGGRWSMKRLHRQIVLSATYRQATGAPPSEDPDNRLLSVFPYRRLDAEQIRDAFLSAAGLLSRPIGGPSVYPPQPESVMQMAYGKPGWPTSAGADRFRRSLYTFSKRTAPFAAFTTFDAPSGELCIARRDRSTTPLQALTLLNDAMYLEMAEGVADDAVRQVRSQNPEAGDREIATFLFRKLLVRTPDPAELESIMAFYHSQSDHPEAWMLVARALMNTDEAITAP
ncbi:DUF1549 domain-containing protein [Roseiconus nitratireducens]|nr:DUF1549 domain-containing protein [Roseiconus nitratireducens]